MHCSWRSVLLFLHSNPNTGMNTYLKKALPYIMTWLRRRNGQTGMTYRYQYFRTSHIRYVSPCRFEAHFTHIYQVCVAGNWEMRLWRPVQVVSSSRSKWWINVSSEGNGSCECLFPNDDICTLGDVDSAGQVSLFYASFLGYITLMEDFASFEQRIDRLWVSWRCKWTSGGLWCRIARVRTWDVTHSQHSYKLMRMKLQSTS